MRSTCAGFLEVEPYVVSPAEKRASVERFAYAQQHSSEMHINMDPSGLMDAVLPEEVQRVSFWAELLMRFVSAHCSNVGHENVDASLAQELRRLQRIVVEATPSSDSAVIDDQEPPQRRFTACVFCGMLDWAETRHCLYLTGPNCTMKNPQMVVKLLSAEQYHKDWPEIPEAELYASAVDFPLEDDEGSVVTTKVLMHKRRVSAEALLGNEPVEVCSICKEAFWPKHPQLSKFCFANSLWLGRHLPMFRDASLGHQLLLALGRVVSTKVYLSSKGVNQPVRQHAEVWRHKFLQQGINGTAIVYGNGSVDHAMEEFPPSSEVLQDTFAAVFCGPES